MSFLARFDPGAAATGLIIVSLVQIIGHHSAGRGLRPDRSAPACRGAACLWLGALILVAISPAVAAVADRSDLTLWVIPLPVPGPHRRSRPRPKGIEPRIDAFRCLGNCNDVPARAHPG